MSTMLTNAAGTDIDPKVWVGCLACYNDGRLVGEWLEGLVAADESSDRAWQKAAGCPSWSQDHLHEEWWVFDHEGYGGMLTGEVSPLQAQRLAETIDSVEQDLQAPFCAWVGYGMDADVEAFEDAYEGEHDSMLEFAHEFADSIGLFEGNDNRTLEMYFNWDGWARDLELGDFLTLQTPSAGVWVFRR